MLEAYQRPSEIRRFGSPKAFIRFTRVSVDRKDILVKQHQAAEVDLEYFRRMGSDKLAMTLQEDARHRRTVALAAHNKGETYKRSIGIDGRFGPFKFKTILPFS